MSVGNIGPRDKRLQKLAESTIRRIGESITSRQFWEVLGQAGYQPKSATDSLFYRYFEKIIGRKYSQCSGFGIGEPRTQWGAEARRLIADMEPDETLQDVVAELHDDGYSEAHVNHLYGEFQAIWGFPYGTDAAKRRSLMLQARQNTQPAMQEPEVASVSAAGKDGKIESVQVPLSARDPRFINFVGAVRSVGGIAEARRLLTLIEEIRSMAG